jgi:hypothetical protein
MLGRLYWMLGRLYWVSIEFKASLAPAEAEVGAVAKADQKLVHMYMCNGEEDSGTSKGGFTDDSNGKGDNGQSKPLIEGGLVAPPKNTTTHIILVFMQTY